MHGFKNIIWSKLKDEKLKGWSDYCSTLEVGVNQLEKKIESLRK